MLQGALSAPVLCGKLCVVIVVIVIIMIMIM